MNNKQQITNNCPVNCALKANSSLQPPLISRRRFFTWLGWSTFGTVAGGSVIATLDFFFPKVLFEPSPSFKAGFPEDYPVGSVTLIPGRRVWIVHEPQRLYAIIAICTHLACQPNWTEDAEADLRELGDKRQQALTMIKNFQLKVENNKFKGIYKCPCHGGRFFKDGVNFAGPPPRPLDRAAISLAEDGKIFVDRSRKFSYSGPDKFGEADWNHPDSFLKV